MSGGLISASEPLFVEYMDAAKITRTYYYRDVWSVKKKATIQKHTPCNIGQWGVPLAPWYSAHVYELARTDGEKKVIEFAEKLAATVRNEFETRNLLHRPL